MLTIVIILGLIATAVLLVCLIAWAIVGTLFGLPFILALCKTAKLRDEAMQANPFKKGEPGSPVGDKRGGDAAPLSFSIDRIVRPI
jgi:hypothetical protein